LIANELKVSNVAVTIIDLDELDWDNVGTIVTESDVFIITGFLEVYRRFFKVNPKILFYNIGDFLIDIGKYKLGINPRSLTKSIIKEMLQKRALIFMDDIGIRSVAEKMDLRINDPLFLPLPVSMPVHNLYMEKAKSENEKIKLTYIGRSVDWKMYPLKKILDDLYSSKLNKHIKFSIVVDSIMDLKKIIDLNKYNGNQFFEIIIHENILPSELNSFLLQHSDINFGMGTSALESGKLGIPTILMDFSTKDLPNNFKYDWLYNTQFFCLGESIEKKYTPPPSGLDMVELIAKMGNDTKYINHQSSQTFMYVKNYHSVSSSVDFLLKFAAGTEFHIRSAQPYVLYYSRFHSLIKRLVK
jgi:hypothetical protein